MKLRPGLSKISNVPSLLPLAASVVALFSAPVPAQPPVFEIAHVQKPAALRAYPGGPVVARLGAKTEFGSPRTLGVVRSHGAWLAVVSANRPNGRLGWVRANAVRLTHTRLSLTLDLSSRTLVLKSGTSVVRRMRVGVGRAGSSTPIGRFAVTDKLSGGEYGPFYGCCIMALSAHQPHLPSGWPGGDRIAIHGTNAPATIGAASSAGSAHARDADLRVLMRRVPLGTPVFIHA
jgi:lipoprotein-anchoring transpeptidase ErfK/SrfK